MKVINLKKEWKRVFNAVHDKPKCKSPYLKEVAQMRDLLLFAQVLLEKIDNRENIPLNSELYPKVMKEYFRQKSELRV